MPSKFHPALNGTLIPSNDCAPGICSNEYAFLDYEPSLATNATYLAIFAVILVAQTALAVRYRTWGIYIAMLFGLVGEIVGYVGRLQMHSNPFLFNNFLTYLIPLTIAPAFFTAAIYLCLGRIINVQSPSVSRLSPRSYTFIFVSCDLVSLILQAVGGALTSTAQTHSGSGTGVNIMIAGLSFQVFSIFVFLGMWADFALRLRKAPESERSTQFAAIRNRRYFKLFQLGLVLATIFIFIRCVFRVAELSKGFAGPIANNQTLFDIFEGPMVFIACILLTVFHPGVAFMDQFQAAGWHFHAKNDPNRAVANTKDMEYGSDSA